MKNILQVLLFFLIMTMIQSSAGAQNKSDKRVDKLLIGTWQFDFKKSMDSIVSGSKTNYNHINEQTRAKITRMYSQRKLSFFSDGTLILESAPGVQKRGIWKLLADQKSLYVKMDDGRELNQTIEKISVNGLRLNLGVDQPKDDGRLFHKWYLQKTNN